MRESLFYLAFATLLTHELDALPNHEWRVIPLLRALPEMTAMTIFVAAHVPLFALLVALVASRNLKTRRRSRLAVAFFLVAHGVLHVLFQNHPAYEFSGLLSGSLIFGGATLGTIYLALEWTRRPVNGS